MEIVLLAFCGLVAFFMAAAWRNRQRSWSSYKRRHGIDDE